METHNHFDGGDPQCESGKMVLEERLRFEKRLQAELPGNPAMVFVGIGFALLAFLAMAIMPGILDYMQDEGIIKPHIEVDHLPIIGRLRSSHHAPDSSAASVYGPAGPYRFGSPRD